LQDALEALGEQRDAVVVVGAQAIYLHSGAIELAVDEYTTDADLTIDPALLHESPEIESAMRAAHFERGNRVGAWIVYRDIAGVPTQVEVDLMVPEAVGGGGRRAARLPGHGKEVARKARGLEAALVDKAMTTIHALDAADTRSFVVPVAGPAALLVAKLHKIAERVSEREQRRLDDKDALDILRLLQATDTNVLAAALVQLLQVDFARDVTREALVVLKDQFTDPRAAGSQMAARAVGTLMSADEIAQSHGSSAGPVTPKASVRAIASTHSTSDSPASARAMSTLMLVQGWPRYVTANSMLTAPLSSRSGWPLRRNENP
jgi:hypothetical protein